MSVELYVVGRISITVLPLRKKKMLLNYFWIASSLGWSTSRTSWIGETIFLHYPTGFDARGCFTGVKHQNFLHSNTLARAIHYRFLIAHCLPITITCNSILCPPAIEVPLVSLSQSLPYKLQKFMDILNISAKFSTLTNNIVFFFLPSIVSHDWI